MITSKKISDLHPKVQEMAKQFVLECKKLQVDVLIYCTYRDNEAQDALYAQGRTKPGKIITRVKGGDSIHNYRLAFDACPLFNGRPVWEDNDQWEKALWDSMGVAAKKVGLEWGGTWKSFPDKPHFQYTNGLTLGQLKRGKTI